MSRAATTQHGPDDRRRWSLATAGVVVTVLALIGGAIWLTIERAPALLLDLAKLPWCG